MADEIVGVADSASGAETAPSEAAVETPDATHGDPTQETPETPTDTPDASESPETDDDDEESPPDQTDEEKTRSQQRRERRQKREAERIEQAVQERFTRVEAERTAKETAAQAEAAVRAAEADFYKEFGELVGTPETRAEISREIAALTSQRNAVNTDPDTATTDDLVRINQFKAEIAAKEAKLAEFDQYSAGYSKLDKFQLAHTQRVCAAQVLKLPVEHRQAYVDSGSMPELFDRYEAGIVAREAAKAAARVAAVEAEWKGKLAREQAAHEATRTGAPGAGPAPNGANGGGGGGTRVLTPARYSSMSFEERQALRSTPEGRAQIDQMSSRPFGAA